MQFQTEMDVLMIIFVSIEDAKTSSNQISAAETIGGYCLNSTLKMECECTQDKLTGESCKPLCPGLIGPIYDETYGNYSFIECSGHGDCVVAAGECSCNLGYTGDGCELEYETFRYPPDMFMVLIILIMSMILVLVASFLWAVFHGEYENILLLSDNMTALFTRYGITMFRCNLGLIHQHRL